MLIMQKMIDGGGGEDDKDKDDDDDKDHDDDQLFLNPIVDAEIKSNL